MLNERTRRIQDSLKETEQVKVQLANARCKDYDAGGAARARRPAGILAQAQERAKGQELGDRRVCLPGAERICNEAREQALQERD